MLFKVPIFLFSLLAFVVWLRFASKRATKLSEKDSKVFWQTELNSNFVRKKDISNLDYITIPIDNLPFKETSDDTLNSVQEQIRNLSEKKILNLTGITNTDLKLAYGMPNLDKLSEYDYNFTLLTRALYTWGHKLWELDYIQDAKTVLEFGIECNVDMMKHYKLLTDIYIAQGNKTGIDKLLVKANTLNSLLKPSIINYLEEEIKNL